MPTQYSQIDPWGNSRRDFPDAESGADTLAHLAEDKTGGNKVHISTMVNKARMYMESRTWDKPVQQLIEAMETINEKAE